MSIRLNRKSILALVVASVATAGIANSALAAPVAVLWSATATSDTWVSGANWAGGEAPVNDLVTNIAEFDQTAYATAGNAPNAGTTDVAGIQFGDGTTAAAAITVAGTQITIGASGISQFAVSAASGVNSSIIVVGAAQTWTNNSANALTIGSTTGSIDTSSFSPALSTTAAGGMVINIGSGSTTFSSATASSTGAFTFNNMGSGSITIAGALTLGTAALNVNGNLVIDGAASYTGATGLASAVSANGVIEYALGNAVQTLGTITDANKGTLTIQSDVGAGQTAGLDFTSVGTHTAGSALNFIIQSGGTSNTIQIGTTTTGTGFITGGAYLTLGAGANTTYGTLAAGFLNPFTGSAAANANAFASATVNYELTENGTDTITSAARLANTIRYSGSGLTLNTSGNALTVEGILNAGTGTLTINGTGTLGVAIGTTNNSTDGEIPNELVLNAANANIEFTGQFNYAGTATQSITLTGPHDVLFNQINDTGADTLTINGAANVSPLYVGSTQTLTFNTTAAGGIVVNSNIADNAAGTSNVDITASAAGVVTFNGTNSYSGVTTIDNSILAISTGSIAGAAGSLGVGSSLVIGNGTLRYVGSIAAVTDHQLTIGDANGNNATLDNSGTLRTVGTISFTNTAPVLFGTPGAHTLNFTGSQAAASSLVTAGLFSPLIEDSGTGATSVTMSGPGTLGAAMWELNAANTYSGGTTISSGSLLSNNAGVPGVSNGFGTGTITVTNGGNAYLAGGSGGVYENNFVITGDGPVLSSGGVPYYGGAITLVSGITLGNSTTTITLNGSARISSFGAGYSTGSVNIAGILEGTGTLTLGNSDGIGTASPTYIVSNPNNNFVGDLLVLNNGTNGSGNIVYAKLGNSNVIPDASNLILSHTGGSTLTFDANGFSDTIAGLESQGTAIDLLRILTNSAAGNSIITLGSAASQIYQGTVTDASTTASLGLTKVGAGTQTLAGTSTYHGATTVAAGTLALDYTTYATSNSTTPTNYYTVNSATTLGGGTLAIVGRGNGLSETPTTTADANKTNTMTLSSVAGLVVGQQVSVAGVTAGTYIASISGNTITLSAAATADVPSGSTITFAATTFTTSQTFKSLALTASSALEADAGPVTFTTTGTTPITGTGTLTLQGTGAGTLAPSVQVTALTMAGPGSWTLTNAANTYTGVTTITGGTLLLAAASNNIASSSKIIVGDTPADSAATLDVTGVTGGFTLGSAQTLAGHGQINGTVTTASGSHIAPGNSVGTLTFNNDLNVVAGTSLDYALGAPSTPGASDLSVVVGNLDLSSTAGSIAVNLTDAGGLADGVYQLFTYGTLSGGAAGDFNSTFFVNSTPLAGQIYTFSNTGASNGEIDLTITPSAVPEPASLALLGLGSVLLLRRKRRV